MKNMSKEYERAVYDELQSPASAGPLSPPPMVALPGTGAQRTRTRLAVVVFLAILASLVLAGAALGASVVYDGQRDTITDLRSERNQIRSENAAVTSHLAKSRSATKTANAKLAVVNKNLRRAKADSAAARKTATAARADSAAAKTAAAAQYGEGFAAGTESGYFAGASDTYDSGWSAGWDVGYDAAYAYCWSVTVC
jgi:hypothetical protein